MFKDYLRIALNSMRRRQLRSWLTILGIIIGITTVVALISLGQGMQNAIESQFFNLGADKLTVQTKGINMGPPGSNSDIQLKTGDLRAVQSANGIAIATARIVEPITVEYNDQEKALYLASLPEDIKERNMVMVAANVEKSDMVHGRALRPSDRWKVIMSMDYYDNPKFDGKALRVGDKIIIENQTVDIVGFYAKTGNPFVDLSFVMNEEPMRDLLNLPDKIGLIIAQVSPGENMDIVAANIEKDLRKHRGVSEGKEDFEVQTAEDLLSTFGTVLSIVTAVLVGIAAISLLVGSVGIMNTMYTSVLERRKEIGIMKAIGARNSDIMIIFLIESGMIGLVGGIIGILFGMGFAKFVEIVASDNIIGLMGIMFFIIFLIVLIVILLILLRRAKKRTASNFLSHNTTRYAMRGLIGVFSLLIIIEVIQLILLSNESTSIIKASYPWYLILGSLLFSFVVGSLAGTFPAYLASKLNPVEALRK